MIVMSHVREKLNTVMLVLLLGLYVSWFVQFLKIILTRVVNLCRHL